MLRSGIEVDLMVTDFLMPGMNGVALIEHATALAPDMKVLLMTGYSNIAEGPGAHVPRLAKPFRQAELSRRVADLLQQEESGEVLPSARRSRLALAPSRPAHSKPGVGKFLLQIGNK